MKILIPMAAFGTAGGARVLSQLANAWIDAGHEVDMLVPPPRGTPNSRPGHAFCGRNSRRRQGQGRTRRPRAARASQQFRTTCRSRTHRRSL